MDVGGGQTQGRLARHPPSRSTLKLTTLRDGSGPRMWLRERVGQVVSRASQEPSRGRGNGEQLSGDQGIWGEGNQTLIFHSNRRVWLEFRQL